MKRRSFLKTLLAVGPVVFGCKAVTMPTDKLLKPDTLENIFAAQKILDDKEIPHLATLTEFWNDEALTKLYSSTFKIRGETNEQRQRQTKTTV